MSEETDRYYAEGYESGAQDLHKWMRRAERAEARVAVLEDYFDNDENSDAWRALNARIRTLEAELRDVLDWAVTEKAPLRVGEIASIRAALAHAVTEETK